MDKQKTSAEAGDDYKKKNDIIKECLVDDKKRAKMNEAMSTTIAREAYDHSLARVLLQPHLIKEGKCPVFSEGEHGPAVVVHLVQSEDRVLECRAFRDSLREEERVKTVRDIEFIPMRGQGIRPSSFPLSNVHTLRWPDLNGDAFNRVERARTRLREALVQDETRVALRALAWVCARFGRSLWAKSATTSDGALRNAVAAVGSEHNPIIVCSQSNLTQMVEAKMLTVANIPLSSRKIDPIFGFRATRDRLIPVYVDQAMSDHELFVVPSGQALGEMPIFIEPLVQDYDKPERLIKGWLCFQDQGMVFTGVKLTNVVYLGWKGAVDMTKNFFRRVS